VAPDIDRGPKPGMQFAVADIAVFAHEPLNPLSIRKVLIAGPRMNSVLNGYWHRVAAEFTPAEIRVEHVDHHPRWPTSSCTAGPVHPVARSRC